MAGPLDEIRKKYPQYQDMPDAELADAIHKKFYADMPREQFNAKVGIKPEAAPVAMEDPGFFGRLEQRATQFNKGIQAPELPADAGSAARIADALMTGHDYLGNITNSAARGFTLGFSDDAAALGTATGKALDGSSLKDVMEAKAANETPGFARDFQQANALENEKLRQFKETNPVAGYGSEILGGVLSPVGRLGTGFIGSGTNMVTRAIRSIPAGAGLGAIAGGGYAEGDLGDRAAGAFLGGATGAVLAPIASAGTEAAINLGGRLVDMGRNAINAYRNPDIQAQRLLAQALARDGVDPQTLMATATRPGAEGLVDAAGPNTVALGRQATVAPGNARTVAQDFFEGRRADAGPRTNQVLADLVPENADDEIARLAKAKLTASRPLYKEAYKADPEALNTPYVREILDSDTGKQALKNARTLWQQDKLAGRVDGSDPFTPLLDAEGNLTLNVAPDMRILDYMKRGMDLMTDAAYKSSSTAGNSMKAVRDAFRDHLKEVNPAYKDALAAYSGPSHVQDLITKGMDFFKGRTQEKLREIAKLSGDDLSAYRIGAVRAAMDKLDNVTDAGSVYSALGNSTAKREQLQALFPSRADFDRVFGQLMRERGMMNAERTVMGGSPTSRIDADKADASDTVGLVGNVMDLLGGNAGGGLRGLMTRAANPARGVTEPVADRLAQFLFNADPAAKQQVIQGLLQAPGGQNLLQQAARGLLSAQTTQRNAGGLLGTWAAQGGGGAVGSVR